MGLERSREAEEGSGLLLLLPWRPHHPDAARSQTRVERVREAPPDVDGRPASDATSERPVAAAGALWVKEGKVGRWEGEKRG